jgi:NAD-dependent dihydropyrimidine dehydrogenase PreA subunit
MIRTIIHIDEEKCSGCGLCASACKENAIAIIDGKAKLLREDYCDGLGNCLPACPMGAISFVERDAAPFDEKAVQAAMAEKQAAKTPVRCPGMAVRTMKRTETKEESGVSRQSHLRQWPVQIRLAPVIAPFYQGADLLIAADCTAYAYAGFHEDLIRDRIVLIGCTKLDDIDYSEKLGEILTKNDIRSVTVARMEVPCCGGMAFAAEKAMARSGKKLPMQTIIIGTDGQIIR